MQGKRFMILPVTILVLLFCLALLNSRKINEATVKAEWNIEVTHKIINRNIVEEDYFKYIEDPALVADIILYNRCTAYLTLDIMEDTLKTLIEFCDLRMDNGAVLSSSALSNSFISDNHKTVIKKFVQYALYSNFMELIAADGYTAKIMAGDDGGKWKEWAEQLHEDLTVPVAGDFIIQDYFELIEGILRGLDTADGQVQKEMIEKVIVKVFNRDVIEDSYLYYLEERFLESILAYNEQTVFLSQMFAHDGAEIIINLCYLRDAYGELQTHTTDHLVSMPAQYHQMIDKITKYALYRNATELIQSDLDLAQIIAGERASGSGQWPRFIHQKLEYTEQFNEYFDLADKVVAMLEEALG